MAVDMFLKIDGITGESTNPQHKGEIELESFSWGISNPNAGVTDGGGSGKVSFQDFSFRARVGVQSPQIFIGAAEGKIYPNALLTVIGTGLDKSASLFKVNFSNISFFSYKEDVLVDSACQKADVLASAVAVLDSASFNFAKVEFQVSDGTTDGGIGEVHTIFKKDRPA
jgi:type VI secretion system secreted protein Hcp